jgi:macrodomain Ter protein organizer (MatP/YcbG family)
MQLVVAVLRIVLQNMTRARTKKEFNAEDTETEQRTG